MQADLAIFDEVKSEIAKYKEINKGLVFDYEDEKGNKEARSHISKLRKIKTAIAIIHKEGKAKALAVGRLYDKEKNENTAEVEEMIAVHNDPIQRIAEREEAEKQAKIDAELARQEAEEEAKRKEIEEREAEVARKEAEIKAKEEDAERVEREKRIAEEAAETANRKAEEAIAKAEQEKKDAIERAEREKKEAVDAEKQKAVDAQEAAEAESERIAQIEADRIANKKHRNKIYDQIHEGIYVITKDVAITKKIADAIVAGKIPNVTINY